MTLEEIERIEVDLLLEAVYRRWGYDFRSYVRTSIVRRVRQFMIRSGYKTVAGMIPRVLKDREFFLQMARYFSVSATEMFRDPFVYRAIREYIVPFLRTWPRFAIWLAGCATGEEVYSIAILLREEGVYGRAAIYGTDFNEKVLEKAGEGIYEIGRMREAARNYQRMGGKTSFSEYYHVRFNMAAMDTALNRNVTLACHNLASDAVFGEMQLILCRNVLIYFNRKLQNRVLELFTESLVNGGFLCLGTEESLSFAGVCDRFEVVNEKAKIYRKKYM